MASFSPRRGKDGKRHWQAYVRRRGYPPQIQTFKTKARAEAWAAGVESEMAQGSFVPRLEAARTTLAEALGRYEREIVPLKAVSAQPAEHKRIRGLQRRSIARRTLDKLGGKDVADFIRDRAEEGVSPNTIRLDLATLSHLYTVARSAWGMPYLTNPVPLARTAMPRLPGGRKRRLEDGEEGKLFAVAAPDFAPVIHFAIATCMRRREIAELTWNHVDMDKRAAHIPKSKNREARTVPLSRAALAALRSVSRRKDGAGKEDPCVFGMNEGAISQAWRRTRLQAEVKGLTFHDLRHEAISRLFESTDLDVMEIARITGHKTLQMLSRYTHLRIHYLVARLDGVPRVSVGSGGDRGD